MHIMRSLGLMLLVLPLSGFACQVATLPTTLPAPDANLGLGNVVMMTWTTRSIEGLMGHASLADAEIGVGIDAHRRPIDGEVSFDSTSQTMRIVASLEKTAGLGAGYGPIGGEVQAGQLTHIAYDVRISGYASVLPQAQRYLSDSGCCMNGAVSPSCGDFFISRMMRGSGTVQYLQQIHGKVAVEAAQIVRAEGGATFRQLSSSEFEDTFFAYEVEPLQTVCARLSPEEEMSIIEVAANDNCFLTIYHRDGSRTTKAYHMPTAALCEKVASAACAEASTANKASAVIECQARHGRDENAKSFSLQIANDSSVGTTGTLSSQTDESNSAGNANSKSQAGKEEPTRQETTSTLESMRQ